MNSYNGFMKKLDNEIAEKHLLKHPFYKTWKEGKLTLEALQGYSKQYYHFVNAFPTFLSAVHSNCPDLPTRQKILKNLSEEERKDKPHPELWIRFGESLGLKREEITSESPLSETRSLVETFKEITRNGSFVEGSAALYAYESQIPEIGKSKVKGLKDYYNITDPDGLEFFTLHIDVDIEHARIGKEIVESGMQNEDYGIKEEIVIQSVRDSLDALWGMLDGIHSKYIEQ
jgi:pyrroloquinoline-quinone synthase